MNLSGFLFLKTGETKMKRIVIISAALVLAFLAFNPLPASGSEDVDSLDLQLIDSSEQGVSLERPIFLLCWQTLGYLLMWR